MYSLGATMCFLLTGAAPLAVSGMKARLRIKRLPELRRAPKVLHNLLVHLLRENPENRPQDPVALEHEMRDCLTKIERRQAIGRKLGIPLAAVIPRKSKQAKEPATPLAQVLRGVVAVAVLILAAGAAAEFFFPDKIPFLHRSGEVGVPIGVPDAARFATTPAQATNAPPAAANRPIQNASPAIASTSEAPPSDAEQGQSSNASPANSITSPTQIWNQIASGAKASQPASPALGPSGPPSSSAPEDSEQSSSTESSESTVPSNQKTIASNRTSTSRSARTNRALPDEDNSDGAPIQAGHHARVVGKTPDGGLIVRLSSGRVVTLPPLNGDGVYRSHPRRRVFVQRPGDYVPPSQPFYPND
jgi:serine/threonine protein kinase